MVGRFVFIPCRTRHALQPAAGWARGANLIKIEATRLSHQKDTGLFKQFYRPLVKAIVGHPWVVCRILNSAAGVAIWRKEGSGEGGGV